MASRREARSGSGSICPLHCLLSVTALRVLAAFRGFFLIRLPLCVLALIGL
jgi:hypothetical protein